MPSKAPVEGIDFRDIFHYVNEELRTQKASVVHRQLRTAGCGSERIACLMQLSSLADLQPRGAGRLLKSREAAVEWLLREADAEDDAERLSALNLAVQFAPTPGPDEPEPRDDGHTLCEAMVRRQVVLQRIGRPADLRANETYLREVLAALPEPTRRKYERQLRDITGAEDAAPAEPPFQFKLPKIYGGLHYKLKRCSALVNVHYTKESGRGLVANETIPPGSVLIVDSPYAWSLTPERWPTHCQNCCREAPAAVPCTHCAAVVFCSPGCRQGAWARFHRAECPIMEHLRDANLGQMALLVVRILLTAGLDTLSPYLDHCDKYTINDVDPHATYDSMDYSTIFDQIPNSEFSGIVEVTRRTTLAVYLQRVLQLTELLPRQLSEPEQLQFTALLLRHLESCGCNAYQMSQLRGEETEECEAEPVQLGGAVCATVSLTNHSCDPNVARINHGRHLVVVTTRTVEAGEELRDNYGLLFHEQPRPQRQGLLLQRYHFTCRCQACRLSWPLYHRLPAAQPRAQVRDLLDTGSSQVTAGDYTGAVQTFSRATELAEQEWLDRSRPDRLVVDCQGFLTRALWLAYRP